ncbi:porin [Roseobacteraceae bacterium S113]
MKNLLLATTALVATAGFAAADVALSGSAEMGVKGGSEQDRTEFHTDISVTFTMTGESDNGISFGASIGLEEAQDGVLTDAEDDYTVFISAGGATLTMGDTDGAFDKALTEVAIGGSIADDHTSHNGYSGNGGFNGGSAPTAAENISEVVAGTDLNGDGDSTDTFEITAASDGTAGGGMGLDGNNDGQIARFDYTFSGVTVSLSSELDDADDGADPVMGIGVAYSADLGGVNLGIGLGYQSQEDFGQVTGISLSTTFNNGLQAILNYSNINLDDDNLLGDDTISHAAIGLGYTMNALTVGVNYGQYMSGGDEAQAGFGVAVNYDLGGGLVAQFGYGSSTIDDDLATATGVSDDSTDTWSLGLAMSF